MNQSNLQMNAPGSTATFGTGLAGTNASTLDRGEALRRARVTLPFALGFVALAASFIGPAEVRGPLLDASVIVFFLLGLAAASNTTTVHRAR